MCSLPPPPIPRVVWAAPALVRRRIRPGRTARRSGGSAVLDTGGCSSVAFPGRFTEIAAAESPRARPPSTTFSSTPTDLRRRPAAVPTTPAGRTRSPPRSTPAAGAPSAASADPTRPDTARDREPDARSHVAALIHVHSAAAWPSAQNECAGKWSSTSTGLGIRHPTATRRPRLRIGPPGVSSAPEQVARAGAQLADGFLPARTRHVT